MQQSENRPLPEPYIFFSSPRMSSIKNSTAKCSKPEKGTQYLMSLQKLRDHSHPRTKSGIRGPHPTTSVPPCQLLEQRLKYKGLSHMSIFFSFLQHETRVLQSTVYERRDHGNDMMVQFVFLPRKFCGKWKMKNKHTTISHHLCS